VTTLDLRTAPRNERGQLIGQGGLFGPSRDSYRHVTFSREPSLEERIYNIVWRGGLVSRADIAKGLDVVKATWLNERIEKMVSKGQLVRHIGTHTNGFQKFFYEVTL
jgi:hypothetical protein